MLLVVYEVYYLRELAQFPGTYGQARYGIAIGTASADDLCLQNESGVIMHLKAKRTGLMLSLGGEAVLSSMRQSCVTAEVVRSLSSSLTEHIWVGR